MELTKHINQHVGPLGTTTSIDYSHLRRPACHITTVHRGVMCESLNVQNVMVPPGQLQLLVRNAILQVGDEFEGQCEYEMFDPADLELTL